MDEHPIMQACQCVGCGGQLSPPSGRVEVLTVEYVTLVQSWCACRHAWEHEKDPVPLHALASSHETLRSQVEVLQRERDGLRALLRQILSEEVVLHTDYSALRAQLAIVEREAEDE